MKKLTILFVPMAVMGHVNPCIGLAEVLRDSGHRIVFAVAANIKGKLLEYGFEEIEYDTGMSFITNGNEAKRANNLITDMSKSLFRSMYEAISKVAIIQDNAMTELVDSCQPDIIVSTAVTCRPYLNNYSKPWVRLSTQNPLFLFNDPSLPPPCSGLAENGDKTKWLEFRQKTNDDVIEVWREFNQWVESKDVKALPECEFITESPYLNIYAYPREIDYIDTLPSNFLRLDYFMRSASKGKFEIPEKLQNKSGKLIYVTMGTLASKDINIMKRLISTLSRSKHRFIVSKGDLHEQLKMPYNMWGQKYLPQVDILPIVDLAIVHGGNNTVTETFYFGKPMIVMPSFADQFDNAQRLHETGYGIRLDLHSYTEQQIFDAIESLLNNQVLREKLKKASERIQSADSLKKAVNILESLVD